jgi:hypothetical protein
MPRPPARIWPCRARTRSVAARLLTAAVTVVAALAAVHAPAAQAAVVAAAGHSEHTLQPPAATLTAGQAMRRAAATGRPVLVTGATTETSTLTANPGGTMTLTEHSVPVRVLQDGRWVPVNAALRRGADGVYPVAASGYLRLSGGGAGPLVVMRDGLYAVGETLQGIRLPAPSLSGATATYAGILPGVDLKVTADTMGGYSDVLVVRDAAAARNPALRHLTFAITTTGLRMHAEPGGSLSFAAASGHAAFTVGTPLMWDSRALPRPVRAAVSPVTGRLTDLRTGQAAVSDAAGPGEAARTASVTVAVTGSRVTYSPDTRLLDSARTSYPLYIDPAAGSTLQGWWQVDTINTGELFTKPSLMQVGYDGWPCNCTSYFTARSFVRMSWPSILRGTGVDILASKMWLQDAWAPSCWDSTHDFGLQVWRTGPVTSSTSWSNQPGWSAEQDAKSFAYGYDSGCPENTAGFNTIEAADTAADGSYTNITFGIRADSESDPYGWKQFTSNVTMSTTYDWAPAVSSPSTSPATTCGKDDTIGLGGVGLYVKASSPDGNAVGGLYPTITVYKGATAAGTPVATYADTSNGYANDSIYAAVVPQATMTGAAGNSPAEFTWTAAVTDKTLTSGTITCHFTYDPTVPGAPAATNCPSSPVSMNTGYTFDITPNPATITPAGYHVQLNAAAPAEATMNTGGSGDATVTLKPTRGTDAVTVTPYSAGGNIGQTYTCIFSATPPAPAADGDMTGDGIPDLVTTGGPGTGMPSGLWLAAGQTDASQTGGDGQIITSPVDIGIEGNGIAGDNQPSDFDGADVITGRFSGDGLQDTLNYYPATGNTSILYGNGDGSVLESEDASNTDQLSSTVFTGGDSANPLQVANAYNAYSTDNSGYPDVITRSATALFYFQNGNQAGSWWNDFPLFQTTGSGCSTTSPCPLQTPDGTTDWNNWQITTMDDPTAEGHVDMFLYKPSTGALRLWQNLTVSQPSNDPTIGLADFTSYPLPWNLTGSLATMRAASILGNGPGLWTVTTSGTVTSWTLTWSNGTPAITADATQNLLPPAHDWRLGDDTSNSNGYPQAADTGGASTKLTLTGNAGATWSGSDLFYPAVQFNGSSGDMTTSGQALNTTGDWSVSAWVKPDTLNGIVLSQYGSNASCMRISIYVNSSGTGLWRLATTSADSTSAISTTVDANTVPVQTGVWTHLTATYNAAANWMELYVNGVPSTGGGPGGTWSSGCGTFALSKWVTGGTSGGYLKGKIADVQTWDTTLNPLQVAAMSMTPGYILFPSDGHHYPAGSTWATAGNTMKFDKYGLHIPASASSVILPDGGTSSADHMAMQTDGNLVIYPATGPALGASNTASNPGDLMFFQPDGNLVIYNTIGQAIWQSGTQ